MVRYEVTDYVDRKKPGQAVIEAFFTKKGNDVYAVIPGWPGREFVLKNAASGRSELQVELLGHAGALQWSTAGGNIRVTMPEGSSDAAKAQYAHVLRFRGLKH